MTSLKEYLFYKGISITDFAKEVGASRNYISQISLGKLKPSKFLAKEIERLTNGEVTAEELLKEE